MDELARNTGTYVPELGAADPETVVYIRAAFDSIPETATLPRHRLDPANLRQLIQDEAVGIERQERFRNIVAAAVERATGIPREEVAHAHA